MKFSVTAISVLAALGGCLAKLAVPSGSPEHAAVFELNAKSSDRILTVLATDGLMYLADSLDISDQYDIGDHASVGDLLRMRAPLRQKNDKPHFVAVVHGMEWKQDEPSFNIDDSDGTFEQSVWRQLARKSGDKLVELTLDMKVSSGANGSALVQHFRLFDDRLVGLWQHYTAKRQAVMDGLHGITERLYNNELAQLIHLDETDADSQTTVFMRLVSMLALGRKIGSDSSSFRAAQAAISEKLQELSSKYNVVVVTIPDHEQYHDAHQHMQKRSAELETVFKRKTSLGSCFKTKDACEAGTEKCSGHGSCAETGKDCWSCACQPSKKDGKTTVWVGYDCGKKDVSAQAHILLWTSLGLLVSIFAGIKLLAGVGSESLPGVLDAATLKKSQ